MAPGSSRLLATARSRCGMPIPESSASHYGDIPIGYTAVQSVLTAPGSFRPLLTTHLKYGMPIQAQNALLSRGIRAGWMAVQLVLTAPGSFRPRRTIRSGYGTCIMVAVPLYYALVDFFFQRALSLQMENILLQGDQAAYISSTWFSRLL